MADTWDGTVSNMPTGRRGVAAITDSSDIVYAIGGGVSDLFGSQGTSANEAYDPNTDSWTSKTNMGTGREEAGIAITSSDIIYVPGGKDSSTELSTNESYDPSTDSWTSETSMTSATTSHGCVASSSNLIYVTAGMNDSTNIETATEEYDPSSGTWTSKTSAPHGGATGGAAVTSTDKLYLVGGDDGNNLYARTDEYDISSDSWTRKADVLTSSRYRHTTASTSVDRIYAICGALSGSTTRTTRTDEYDPSSDTWTQMSSASTGRDWPASATTSSDNIFALGGSNANSTFLSTNEKYDAPTSPAAPTNLSATEQ